MLLHGPKAGKSGGVPAMTCTSELWDLNDWESPRRPISKCVYTGTLQDVALAYGAPLPLNDEKRQMARG
jgi:hypothetical protein